MQQRRLEEISDSSPSPIHFVTHLLQVDQKFYMPIAFAAAGPFAGQVVCMLSGEFCEEIYGQAERRRFVSTAELEMNTDYVTGKSQDSPHVVPLNKMLFVLLCYPIRNRANKQVAKFLRNHLWNLALSGNIPNLFDDKALAAIEVPKANTYLSDISLAVYEQAQRARIRLLSRTGISSKARNSAALFDYQMQNVIQASPVDNSSLLFQQSSFVGLDLMNQFNQGDTNRTNNSNIPMLPMLPSFQMGLMNLPDISSGDGANLFRGQNFALGNLGVDSLSNYPPFIPPLPSLPPSLAAGVDVTPINNTYFFRVVNNRFIGPASEIFHLLDIPVQSWASSIGRLAESDRFIVDMKTASNDIRVRTANSQSYFLSVNGLALIAQANPTRLNRHLRPESLQNGLTALFDRDFENAFKLCKCFEQLQGSILNVKTNGKSITCVDANRLMTVCGFNPENELRKREAISIANPAELEEDYDYFVVNGSSVESAIALTARALPDGVHLGPNQMYVFSKKCAERLLISRESGVVWRLELLASAHQLVQDVQNPSSLSNNSFPPRPAEFPMALVPWQLETGIIVPNLPIQVEPGNWAHPGLPALPTELTHNDQELRKRKADFGDELQSTTKKPAKEVSK